jgi:hypothetical protein
MISDDDIERAVDYLRDNAGRAAAARANRIYMEEYRKVVKAEVMRELPDESIGAQEARAYSGQRYKEHLVSLKESIREDEYHRWMMAAAEAKIEAWRTQQANNRTLGKI